MKFGPVPVAEAEGAIAAHSLRAGEIRIRKGERISAEVVSALQAGGHDEVVAVRLEPGDVGEDEAALRLAKRVAGEGIRVEAPFTGRSNLFARGPGLLVVDRTGIDGINAIDEAVTLATLPAFKPVVEGEMVATVKIIPYAVAGSILERAMAAAAAPVLRLAPYLRRRVAVISTLMPGLKPATVAKTLRVFQERLSPAGAEIASAAEAPHETDALARVLAGQVEEEPDLIVVFGASAIADRRDVIPAAIEQAGGSIVHFGMPVDPGNLLLVGDLAGIPVIGAPGCARSPVENGFDWVLQRLLAGIPVTGADIKALGVGGLLMEVVQRGQPRGGGEAAVPEDEEES